ncbi:hypothetical protein FQA39_LY02143 [Lamprigera yunnana]|nr:hypothetical protein FQA39_LY02143 [Lamprigera yunnana]
MDKLNPNLLKKTFDKYDKEISEVKIKDSLKELAENIKKYLGKNSKIIKEVFMFVGEERKQEEKEEKGEEEEKEEEEKEEEQEEQEGKKEENDEEEKEKEEEEEQEEEEEEEAEKR